MNARILAGGILKAMGIYWFFQAIRYLPFGHSEKLAFFINLSLLFVFYVLAGYFFVFRTNYLLEIIKLGKSEAASEVPASSAIAHSSLVELADIILKAVGIYWFVEGISSLPQGTLVLFYRLENRMGVNWTFGILSMLLFFTLYVLISYIFVFRTSYLLKVIKLDELRVAPNTTADAGNYKSLAFSLLGTFFAVTALSKIIADLIKLLQLQRALAWPYEFWDVYVDLGGSVITLIIGIALIAGRERLSQWVKKSRPLAVDEADDEVIDRQERDPQ